MRFPKGKSIDTRDLDSLAPAFKRGESRCGVYRLRFANGEAYCGQATNVIRRYGAHRRHYPDIVGVDFFPFSKARLNEAEQILITETEQLMPLRNVMLAGRPRGDETIEIVTAAGSTVALPWEPERAKGPAKSLADEGEEKFANLLTHPMFPTLRSILGWYIALTIPDPAATAGQLWTATCLPSTNKSDNHHRLITISCGNLETLYITADHRMHDGSFYYTVRINTSSLDNYEQFRDPESGMHRARWGASAGRYSNEHVGGFWFDPEDLDKITHGEIDFPQLDAFVDAAYELNVRLMRRGSTMYSRFHNQKLADLLIAEAVIWESILAES